MYVIKQHLLVQMTGQLYNTLVHLCTLMINQFNGVSQQ